MTTKAKKKKAPNKALARPRVLAPDLKHGPFSHGASGLKVDGTPTFEEWYEAVGTTKSLAVYGLWFYGDLMAYGQHHFGEDYAQALDASDYSDNALALAEWVARKFPPERRHPELTFSHHKLVAALPPKEADRILTLAADQGLSTVDVGKIIRAKKSQESTQESGENKGKTFISREMDSVTNGSLRPIEPTPEPEPPVEPADPSEEFVSTLNTMTRELDEFARRVEELKQSPFGRFVHWQSARDQIKNARETLHAGRPTHECPYCAAAGEPQPKCRTCAGLGVCTKSTWKAGVAAVGGASK